MQKQGRQDGEFGLNERDQATDQSRSNDKDPIVGSQFDVVFGVHSFLQIVQMIIAFDGSLHVVGIADQIKSLFRERIGLGI